jgi:hypothetical protein
VLGSAILTQFRSNSGLRSYSVSLVSLFYSGRSPDSIRFLFPYVYFGLRSVSISGSSLCLSGLRDFPISLRYVFSDMFLLSHSLRAPYVLLVFRSDSSHLRRYLIFTYLIFVLLFSLVSRNFRSTYFVVYNIQLLYPSTLELELLLTSPCLCFVSLAPRSPG